MSDHKHAQRIDVVTRILKANDRLAEENRRRFEAAGVYVVDLVSSPGAGKTALLETTIPRLEGRLSVGVILGDVATTRDAERIAPLGVPLIQITTESFGGACHLEASSLVQALDRLDLDGLDLLFVENVGNLICRGRGQADQISAGLQDGGTRARQQGRPEGTSGRRHAGAQGAPRPGPPRGELAGAFRPYR
jgi:hydrogenase accessory protein HypB